MSDEIIIALVALGSGALSTVVGAAVSVIVAKISNSDKAKKEVSDFILSFWTKEDIEKLVKTGEINTYDKNSQKKIQEYYEKLKAEEKKEEDRPLVVNTFDDFDNIDPRIIAAARGLPKDVKLPKNLRPGVSVATKKKKSSKKKDDDDDGALDW